MIQDYYRPQLTIKQLLQTTTAANTSRLAPIVIGPQYKLSRYGVESAVPSYAFNAAGQSLPYQFVNAAGVTTTLASDHLVDLSYTKLFAEGLEAELAHFATSATNKFYLDSLLTPNVIRLASVNVAGGTIDPLLLGRPVTVGDIVYVNDGVSAIKRRTVTGLKGKRTASHYGQNTAGDDSYAGNSAYNTVTDLSADALEVVSAPSGATLTVANYSAFNALVRGSILNGKYGEEFVITVRLGGAPGTATVDVSSKSGLWNASGVATANSTGSYSITNTAAGGELAGLNILIAATPNLVQGQVFRFRVYGAYERIDTTDADADTKFSLKVSDLGSGYTGAQDTTYLIRIVQGTASGVTGAVVQVSDTAGIDTVVTSTITSGVLFNVGSFGLRAKIDFTDETPAQGGLRAGDVYFIRAFAASESTTQFDAVILDGPAADTTVFNDISTAVDVRFRLPFTGQIAADAAADGSAFTTDSVSINVDSGLSLYVSGRSSGNRWVSFVDGVGSLFTSWRAIVPVTDATDKITINSVSAITDNIGSTTDLDNDLAYAAGRAFSGAQGLTTYALNTGGTSLESFVAALRKLESTDAVYALAPQTDDIGVLQAVGAHVDSMSAETKKNFRRFYYGTSSPGSYLVLKKSAAGTNITATVGSYAGANTLVTTQTAGVNFLTLGLETGDRFILPVNGLEYKIKSVLSATELLLASGPASPLSPAVPFELWKADTANSQAAYVIQRSKAVGSRRGINVWVENGTAFVNGETKVIPTKYVAAEIAGLRCAVLPQQGLTQTEVTSVTSAPSMFVRYTPEQLDAIAANGVMIVTQDVESGAVFIRHQLTTDVSKGSLYYEDSVGVNLDNISFGVKDLLTGYIGKRNVNGSTLALIKTQFVALLNGYTQTDSNSDIGPALNSFTDVVVAIDPILKDRINVSATLRMPLPLNHIDVTLNAVVDTTL